MKKYNITVNGTTYEVCVEEVSDFEKNPMSKSYAPNTATPEGSFSSSAPTTSGMPITVHIPGTVTDIKVSLGQYISKGDIICTLEAMKIENEIPSPQSGTVSSINIQKGSTVNAGDTIITLN